VARRPAAAGARLRRPSVRVRWRLRSGRSLQAVGSHAAGFRPHIRWRCCAVHVGVSFNSWLVGGVLAVTAEPAPDVANLESRRTTGFCIGAPFIRPAPV